MKQRFRNKSNKSKKDLGERDWYRGILYYLLAIYIGYMGISILGNRINGDDTMSYPIAIFFALIFVVGAIWVFWYGFGLRKEEVSDSNVEIDDELIHDELVHDDTKAQCNFMEKPVYKETK